MAKQVIADQLEVRVEDLDRYIDKLNNVFELKDMKGMDELMYVKEKFEITAVVDGVITEGTKTGHYEQVSANEAKTSVVMNSVIKKTRKMKVPNDVRFAQAPEGNASMAQKRAAPLRNVCRFVKEGKPCPFGAKCKFYHAPPNKDRLPTTPN